MGFRYTAKNVAMGFEVAGAVRNLPDGRVELIAEAPKDELEAFRLAIRDSGLGSFISDEQVTWEDDAVHGFKGLHDIRSKVEAMPTQYPQVLGKLADKYKGPYVWELPQWR